LELRKLRGAIIQQTGDLAGPGREVLTELSLNGVGVGNLMVRAPTAQSWKARRNPIPGLRFFRNGMTS